MAEKKKNTKKIGRAPSLKERITDFSTGGYSGGAWIPIKPTKPTKPTKKK